MPSILPQSAAVRVAVASGQGEHQVAAVTSETGAVALTLNSRGVIRGCSGANEALFNYPDDELLGSHISLLLPELEDLELVRNGETNPRLRFQCRIGRPYAAVTRDGLVFASKLFLSVLDSGGDGRLSLIVQPAEPLGNNGQEAFPN